MHTSQTQHTYRERKKSTYKNTTPCDAHENGDPDANSHMEWKDKNRLK